MHAQQGPPPTKICKPLMSAPGGPLSTTKSASGPGQCAPHPRPGLPPLHPLPCVPPALVPLPLLPLGAGLLLPPSLPLLLLLLLVLPPAVGGEPGIACK